MNDSLPSATEVLFSFDGTCRASSTLLRPNRTAELRRIGRAEPLIARGTGVSYAPASFLENGTTVDLSMFDRILAFDSATGVVELESGIRLGELHDFLAPRGWYMPVQPGHGRISVGGCIAADVHGKNQAKDGNFSAHVLSVDLFHPDHGVVSTSRAHEPVLFDATCGGYGLTGIIVSARLQARRLPGSTFAFDTLRVGSAADAAADMRRRVDESDILYSWHDFAGDRQRGLVSSGRFVQGPALAAPHRSVPLSAAWRRALPFSVLDRRTTAAVNSLYYAIRGRPRSDIRVALRRGLFPIEGQETYFRLFGRPGFREYQAVVPHDAFTTYAENVRALARTRGIPIALASGKIFDGETRFLRFTGRGVCLAINVPAGPDAEAYFADLDRLLIELGGRPNIIKDSRLSASMIEATYPDYAAFKAAVADFDRRRLFQSALSKRIGI